MEITDERKPRHKWSVKDRQLLCILSVRSSHDTRLSIDLSQKLYENSAQEMTLIINHIFTDDLRAEGFQSGLPVSTIHAQLNDMRQGSCGYETWRAINIDMSISEARRNYRDLRDSIEDAALALEITLHLRGRGPDHFKPHGYRLGQRDRKIQRIRGVLGELVSSDDTESDLRSPRKMRRTSYHLKAKPKTPTRPVSQGQLLTPKSITSGGTTPGSGQSKWWTELTGGKHISVNEYVDEFGNKARRFPRLIYRWYSLQSQGVNTPTEIRAGQFLDKSKAIPPPKWDMKTVANHLIPEKRPSPYISFRESLLPCVVYAIWAGCNADATITIVDLQKVKAVSLQWGYDVAIPCAALIKKFKLKLGKMGKYRGRGEWLVYG